MAQGTMQKVTNNGEYNSTSKKGYCKMPDGTLIQWGNFTFPAASTGMQEVTIDFPVPFVDTYAAVIPSWRETVALPQHMGMVYVKNTWGQTNFVLQANRLIATYSWGGRWMAVGRWK